MVHKSTILQTGGGGGGTTIGGAVTGGTPGSVLYVDPSGDLGQDPTNFFYDPTTQTLHVNNIAANIAAAGSNTDIQFNNGGVLGASDNFQYNGTTQTTTINDIRAAATDGLTLQNTALSTASILQQFSPSIHFSGSAWGTTSLLSTPVDARLLLNPASGTGPSGSLTFQFSNNGGAYATGASLASNGVLTLGTSGAFVVANVSANLVLPSTTGTIGTTVAQFQYGGSTTNNYRVAVFGSTSTSIATATNYSAFQVGKTIVTTAASSTIPWIANAVINTLGTITIGSGGSVTNTAILYLGPASIQATNNYGLYQESGQNYFGGSVGLLTTVPTHTLTLGSTATGIVQYNTADQTTNYQRMHMFWNSGVYNIANETGGSGASSDLQISMGAARIFNMIQGANPAGIYNFAGLTSTAGASSVGINTNFTSSSTFQQGLAIVPQITQTGTAGFRGAWISPFISSSGSGSQLLIDAGTNSAANGSGTHTSKFSVDLTGIVNSTSGYVGTGARLSLGSNGITGAQVGATGGVSTSAVLGNIAGVASALNIGAGVINSSGTSGTIPIAGANIIGIPTFTTSSATTLSNATTWYIDGPPIAGTNVTITQPSALYVNSGLTILNGGIATGPGTTTCNFFAAAGTGISATASGTALFGTAASVGFRVLLDSSGASTLATNQSYAAQVIGSSPINKATTGAHNIVANLAINPVGTIAGGAATIDNTSTLYIKGAATGGTNNYALWSAAGLNRFSGPIEMDGSTSGNVTLSAAATTTSYPLTLPAAQGAANTLPANDGSGNLSWVTGGVVLQRVFVSTGAVATGTTAIPQDDTIPQQTEGDQYITASITPTNANTVLVIEGMLQASATGNSQFLINALFQDATANALKVGYCFENTGTGGVQIFVRHIMTSGTTSSTAFKLRGGAGAVGTFTLNGQNAGRLYGGSLNSYLMITEYLV